MLISSNFGVLLVMFHADDRDLGRVWIPGEGEEANTSILVHDDLRSGGECVARNWVRGLQRECSLCNRKHGLDPEDYGFQIVWDETDPSGMRLIAVPLTWDEWELEGVEYVRGMCEDFVFEGE